MKKSSNRVSWIRASLAAIALLVIGGAVVVAPQVARAQTDSTSCLCNCYFDRDCAPGYFCNFRPADTVNTVTSCLSNNLQGNCGNDSKVCDGVCTRVGLNMIPPLPQPDTGYVFADCDAALYGSCECNPRLNNLPGGTATNPACAAGTFCNPNCPSGKLCVSDGGCCTQPNAPGAIVATRNGRCVDPDSNGTGVTGLCGNGVVDPGEGCDPGDRANGVPEELAACPNPADDKCVNCVCVEKGFCGLP